jgi:hypothetical protein
MELYTTPGSSMNVPSEQHGSAGPDDKSYPTAVVSSRARFCTVTGR